MTICTLNFFRAANIAHYKLMFIETGCIFDTDDRTDRFRRLRELIYANGLHDLSKKFEGNPIVALGDAAKDWNLVLIGFFTALFLIIALDGFGSKKDSSSGKTAVDGLSPLPSERFNADFRGSDHQGRANRGKKKKDRDQVKAPCQSQKIHEQPGSQGSKKTAGSV